MTYKFRAWLRLVRLPNLFTVPGDVFAGFFLAGGCSLVSASALPLLMVTISSLALYAAGIVLNDIVDRDVDRKERPARPIPSGAISLRQAWIAFASLTALAFVFCGGAVMFGGARFMPLIVAAVLLALIVAYDSRLRRRSPLLGIVLMGLCRGLNVLLGASVVANSLVCSECGGLTLSWPLSGGIAVVVLFVCAFSEVARREMDALAHDGGVQFRLALPFLALMVTLVPLTLVFLACGDNASSVPMAFAGFAVVMTLLNAWLCWKFFPRLVPMSEVVGRHIQNLIRVQASLAAGAAAMGLADWTALGVSIAALFVALPLFRKVASFFEAS